MLPAAWERENAQERYSTKAVFAGIAAAFSKQGWAVSERNFTAVKARVRRLQRAIRGGNQVDKAQQVDLDVAALDEAFGGMRTSGKPSRRARG